MCAEHQHQYKWENAHITAVTANITFHCFEKVTEFSWSPYYMGGLVTISVYTYGLHNLQVRITHKPLSFLKRCVRVCAGFSYAWSPRHVHAILHRESILTL